MQTFLPFPDFKASHQCLDDKRSNKQISEGFECYYITRRHLGDDSRERFGMRDEYAEMLWTRYRNHPAARMWIGYDKALLVYVLTNYTEWATRFELGKRNGSPFHVNGEKIVKEFLRRREEEIVMPEWFGNEEFHRSHRSNLLRKKYDWYVNWFNEPNDLPYVWPR